MAIKEVLEVSAAETSTLVSRASRVGTFRVRAGASSEAGPGAGAGASSTASIQPPWPCPALPAWTQAQARSLSLRFHSLPHLSRTVTDAPPLSLSLVFSFMSSGSLSERLLHSSLLFLLSFLPLSPSWHVFLPLSLSLRWPTRHILTAQRVFFPSSYGIDHNYKWGRSC